MKKLMTTIAAAALLAVASVAYSTAANAGAVLDKILQTKTLTAAVGTDWGKMAFLNDKHELDGYDIEVVKRIAKDLGVEAKFVTPSWDVVAAGKWEGRWDMTTWMTPTQARTEKFAFPAVYINDEVLGAVHKDSKVTKLSELEGKVVGVAAGTAAESYVNHKLAPDWIGATPLEYQFKPGEVKTYASSNVAFDDLRLGDGVRIDAVLGDGSLVQDAIKAGYPLKEVGVAFDTPAAIAIAPGDKEFNDKIAAIVQSMKDDGSLSKLSIKWFGTDRAVK